MKKISAEDDFSTMARKKSGSIKMARWNSTRNYFSSNSKKNSDEKFYRHGFQYELLCIAYKLTRTEETNITAKEIVASYLHELFRIKNNERQLRRLLSIFDNLVASAENS